MFSRLWWLLWMLEHHEFLAENLREFKRYGLRRPKPKHILSNTVEKYASPSDQGEYCHFKTAGVVGGGAGGVGEGCFPYSFLWILDYMANLPSKILLTISQACLILHFHMPYFCTFIFLLPSFLSPFVISKDYSGLFYDMADRPLLSQQEYLLI